MASLSLPLVDASSAIKAVEESRKCVIDELFAIRVAMARLSGFLELFVEIRTGSDCRSSFYDVLRTSRVVTVTSCSSSAK